MDEFSAFLYHYAAGVNGQILNLIETKERKLKKEDRILVIPIFD